MPERRETRTHVATGPPRYGAFVRPRDIVVLEIGCSSSSIRPMTLADWVRVEAEVL
jgi:hypothetical protein